MNAFDQRMAELRLRFQERAAGDRETLLQAVSIRDLEALRQTSHGLAGTAGIFGFTALGDAAQQVEDALDAGANWPQLEAHCRSLIDALALGAG